MSNDLFTVFRTQLLVYIASSEHIVITSHLSPDDDSIASVLAAYTIVTTLYPEKKVRMVYGGEPVARYAVFHHFDKIEFVTDVAGHLNGADTLLMLDAGQYARFSKSPDVLKKVPTTIAIDHHASVPDHFTLSLILPEYSSNAELVYRVFAAESMLTKVLAEQFLLGILGDTGNFSYIPPSQVGLFAIAEKLIAVVGVSISEFRARYGMMSKRVFTLIQELMKHTAYAQVTYWPDVQYSFIERSIVAEGGYTDEELSAASHIYLSSYLPRVSGYTWGFVITPRADGSERVSGRSLPKSVNVRDFFERIGIGGGHDRASGGAFKENGTNREAKECIALLLDFMQNNKPVLV